MRVSAKLNIYLGVPNFSDDLLPQHLAYIKSYFRKRAWNWLFPISVTGAVLLIAMQVGLARGQIRDGLDATGATLLGALAALALLEHLFMFAPVRDSALWTWAFPSAPKSTKT
jgi:putative photosynthetic complex assembly protein 2